MKKSILLVMAFVALNSNNAQAYKIEFVNQSQKYNMTVISGTGKTGSFIQTGGDSKTIEGVQFTVKAESQSGNAPLTDSSGKAIEFKIPHDLIEKAAAGKAVVLDAGKVLFYKQAGTKNRIGARVGMTIKTS